MKFRPPETRITEYMLLAVAAWRAALGIAALTACVRGWTGEYLMFAGRQLALAIALAWVVMLLRDNRRLRTTPLWRAADDAWRKGYDDGRRSAR